MISVREGRNQGDCLWIQGREGGIKGGEAITFRNRFQRDAFTTEAGRLVSKYFSAADQLGILRLKESPYYRPELQIDDFMSALKEIFPCQAAGSS